MDKVLRIIGLWILFLLIYLLLGSGVIMLLWNNLLVSFVKDLGYVIPKLTNIASIKLSVLFYFVSVFLGAPSFFGKK